MIIGIDPGISGAIAAVDAHGRLLWVEDMPIRDSGKQSRKQNEVDGAALGRLLRLHVMDIDRACVESVHAMPAQGVSSMFSMGETCGVIRGVLEALCVPVVRVQPQAWKRAFGLLRASKDQSRAEAIRLFPASGDFGRKKDHGRAEAALIARWSATEMGRG